MPPGIEIRPLRRDEGAVFRALRIAALTDAPDAFGPTLADALAQPETYWQQAAERFHQPGHRLLLAVHDGEPAGMISAVRDAEGRGHLGSFWTGPAVRGSGAGGALFDAAVAWLHAQGCATITLSVTETNTRAIAMYERRGFRLSGAAHPLRPGSVLRELVMVRRT